MLPGVSLMKTSVPGSSTLRRLGAAAAWLVNDYNILDDIIVTISCDSIYHMIDVFVRSLTAPRRPRVPVRLNKALGLNTS